MATCTGLCPSSATGARTLPPPYACLRDAGPVAPAGRPLLRPPIVASLGSLSCTVCSVSLYASAMPFVRMRKGTLFWARAVQIASRCSARAQLTALTGVSLASACSFSPLSISAAEDAQVHPILVLRTVAWDHCGWPEAPSLYGTLALRDVRQPVRGSHSRSRHTYNGPTHAE